MIPSVRKRRRLFILFFCVCVAFFSSSSFFCSSSSSCASDDAFDFDGGVGGVYAVEEEEERQQKRRRRILRTRVNDDEEKTRTMIPPKWARARNENDLETDRKYVLKNNGRGEENKTLTRRARAYANFENAFAEGSSSWKVKASKRMPAKTCAERKWITSESEDESTRRSTSGSTDIERTRNDENSAANRGGRSERRRNKQLGIVIVVCLENISTLLREIDCEKTNVYAYVKCAQHVAFDEDVEEKVDTCVTVIHSKITRRPEAKMHVEWIGHILANYDDEKLEPNLMFLKGVYRNKGQSNLEPAWVHMLESEEQTHLQDFSFACLMDQSIDFPTRSENFLDITDSEKLLCSMYERYACEKDTCKNFLGCSHSMFAASSERIRSLPKTEYAHLFDFLMNERSEYHIYTFEKAWSVILGCAKTYGEYSTRVKTLPLRVRCGRGEYGTFDVARILSPWWKEILTRQDGAKSPAITMAPCENRTKHFHDAWFPCGLW